MAQTVGEYVVRRLRDWGVQRVFGYPGDGINIHSSAGWSSPRVVPRDEDLKRAAEVLNAGEKVAMLVGAGCLHAADEVVQVADALGAGIAKALLGKAVLPDDTPACTGSIGLTGTKPSYDRVMGW